MIFLGGGVETWGKRSSRGNGRLNMGFLLVFFFLLPFWSSVCYEMSSTASLKSMSLFTNA